MLSFSTAGELAMARTLAALPEGSRITDYIRLGVVTQGAWYGELRLVSLDGSTLDVADEQANDEAFGRPGASRGESAYPQIRFVSLVENGTHVLFGSRMADYATSETALAKTVLPSLTKGMLCLSDPGFFGFGMGN